MPGGDMASPEPARPVPLLGPTTASSMLVGATCVAAILDGWTSWYRHDVAVEYDAGEPGIGVADLTSASSTGSTVDTLYVFAMIGAAMAVLVWLSRVRAYARTRGRAGSPLPRKLVVGAWFAVSLFSVVTTILFGGNAEEAELVTVARIDSFDAAGVCLVGVVLILTIQRTTHRILVETNQRGGAMRG